MHCGEHLLINFVAVIYSLLCQCDIVILWYSDIPSTQFTRSVGCVLSLFCICQFLFSEYFFSENYFPTDDSFVVSATQITINKLYFDNFIAEMVFHFIPFHFIFFPISHSFVWTSYRNHLAKCQFQFKIWKTSTVGRWSSRVVYLLQIPTNYHCNRVLLFYFNLERFILIFNAFLMQGLTKQSEKNWINDV